MTEIFHPGKGRRINVTDITVKTNDTYDKDGDEWAQQYVEFTVIGKHTHYQDFILLPAFKKHNPHIMLDSKEN